MSNRFRWRDGLFRFGFLVPAFAFFAFAMIIPFFMGIHVAFTDWNGIIPEYRFVGLDNFAKIFTNDDILIPMRNTLYYMVLSVVFSNSLALLLAMAVNRSFAGKHVTKVIFFLPTVLSAVLVSFIWGFIYREVFHTLFGINSLLGSPDTVMPAIVGIDIWNSVGISMIIYLSALTGVPRDLYEAAEADGATVWQKFANVTVPMIMPAITVNVTLAITYGLRVFTTPIIATNGGPVRASETIAIYIYRHLFDFKKAGYGQAISMVFLIALVVIGWTVSRMLRSKEVEM